LVKFFNLTHKESILMAHRFLISQDSPSLYITVVTKDRLPVFRSDRLKQILCSAINEARQSAGFLLFAYVIMIDHLHLLTNRASTTSDLLRVFKGLTARRVIDYLKENNFASSLGKLQHEERERKHKYSLWQVEKNVLPVFSERMFMQKVNYIHQNPVRAGLVEQASDYRWSSDRMWHGRQLENEPLLVDRDLIHWRRGRMR
jgi:REP-associated tyrosine transposase